MNEEEIKQAVRKYIDSIKNEPWYDVTLDDVILEAWKACLEWYKNRQAETGTIDLYQCASLFAESMNDRFPNGCAKGSAIFMVASNGDKVTSIIDGKDPLIGQMLANVAAGDVELAELIGNSMVAAINYNMKKRKEEQNND